MIGSQRKRIHDKEETEVKKSFLDKAGNVFVGGQLVALALCVVIIPPLVIVLMFLYGVDFVFEECGGLVAFCVILFVMMLRYFVRKLVCVIKKDKNYYAKKVSIMEKSPWLAAFGIVGSMVLFFFIAFNANMFWAVLVGFFGCFFFAAKSLAPEE